MKKAVTVKKIGEILGNRK